MLFVLLIGGYQVLLPLSLTPIAVLYGSGSSYEEARKQAAVNGLNYLKLLTKKPVQIAPPAAASSSLSQVEQPHEEPLQEIPVEAALLQIMAD